MSEWFYDALQATAGIIDPTAIKPYEWMDLEFGRKGTRGGEVLVGPCDLEHVSVIAYIGKSQLERTYRLSVEDNDLVIELTDTCFNGVGEEAFSRHDLAQVEGFETIFDLQKFLKGMRRTFAEHYARGAIEDWRQAELEHRDIEAQLRSVNDEIIPIPSIIKDLLAKLDGERCDAKVLRMQKFYEVGVEKAQELSKKGDNARCQADKMRSEMIAALHMFKKIAPSRALPVDVQYLGDEPNVGYSLGM